MIQTFSPFPGAAPRALTVLVADDSVENQHVLRQYFEDNGHTVYCVSDGNEAVRLLARQSVDIVITEVIMPNGDGLEVILEAKKRQPQARLIAMSAGGRYLPATDCLRVAKGLGAHETLLKPVLKEQVAGLLERIGVAVPCSS